MRLIAGIALACLTALPVQAQDETSFQDAVRAVARPVTYSPDGLAGPGGDWLLARSAETPLVGFGEQHATADIALFAQAWFVHLDEQGFDHAIIEVGPWGTRRAEALLRAGDEAFERDAAARADGLAYPFLFFQEEADLARMIVDRQDSDGPALFGVDQEFIAGGSILAERLDELAATDHERAAVARFETMLAGNPWAVGAAPHDDLVFLAEAFEGGDAEAQAITSEVLASNTIYAAFTGRSRDALAANTRREEGMRRYFLEAWPVIVAESDGEPRAFFKFGGNHLMRGHTRTHVPGFGGFLAEWGFANDLAFFNVMVDCDGGEMRDVRSGETTPCSSYFPLDGTPFEGLAGDGPVVIDLAALRQGAVREDGLDPGILRLILAFDAYVILPDVQAATRISDALEN